MASQPSWTILNQSAAAISVNDIPEPQELLPNTSGQFLLADILSSLTLSVNLALGALVVTSMGAFGPAGPWAPVTYPLWTQTTSQTQSGNSLLVTTGTYSAATLLVNTSALVGTLTFAWSPYDGTNFYPAQTLLTVSATGSQAPVSIPIAGPCGRLSWTIASGDSATFTAYGQMR